MKNFRWVFIAVALIGILSAFKTKTFNDEAFLFSSSPVKYKKVIMGDKGTTWDCVISGTYCLYILKVDATPDANGLYDEDDIEGPDETTAGKHYTNL